MNVGKTKVMRIPMQPLHIPIMKDQKQPENVVYYRYLGSMVTKNQNVRVRSNPPKKKTLIPSKLDFNIQERN